MSTPTPVRTDVDPDLLEQFMGRAVADLGATVSAALMVIGDRLGLYRTLAEIGPVSAERLAQSTGTALPYLRAWLANQAAGGYVEYDADEQSWSMTPEQTLALAVEDGPAFFPGSMQLALAVLRDVDPITERFRTGAGFGWHEHDAGLFEGTERFFRPGYVAGLIEEWLPAMDGVVEKLDAGAHVADVGCGHGASTILLAQAFPRSTFVGSDYHEASVLVARRRAAAAGVADRVRFEVAEAAELDQLNQHDDDDGGFDLVAMFDCLHDMGDPDAAARAVRRALRPDGTFLLVEPAAGDHVQDNLHPVGRVFYAASALVCTPASLSQPGARALGPQAGPAVLTSLLSDAGFSRVRLATHTPVNLVLEARP